jgi:hypothetical protein
MNPKIHTFRSSHPPASCLARELFLIRFRNQFTPDNPPSNRSTFVPRIIFESTRFNLSNLVSIFSPSSSPIQRGILFVRKNFKKSAQITHKISALIRVHPCFPRPIPYSNRVSTAHFHEGKIIEPRFQYPFYEGKVFEPRIEPRPSALLCVPSSFDLGSFPIACSKIPSAFIRASGEAMSCRRRPCRGHESLAYPRPAFHHLENTESSQAGRYSFGKFLKKARKLLAVPSQLSTIRPFILPSHVLNTGY